MTHAAHPQPDALLDLYLDDMLDDEQRDAFERDLADDPMLREELLRQGDIDASLRRMMTPPAPQRLRDLLDGAPKPRKEHPSRRETRGTTDRLRFLRPLAIAASVMLCVLGGWMIWSALGPGPRTPDPYAPQPWRSMQAVYEDKIESGFRPDWVCRTDEEFQDTFRRQLGQRLLVDDLPDDAAMLGLAYSNTITRWTISMLAEADGRRVIVFIDRLEADDGPTVPEASDLNVFRRELGKLVLYELSPLEEPRLLPHFYDPDAQDDDSTRPGQE
ncbi:MAG: hypothetical protein SYC29_09855 [Planctomycetota bacterium]|nr:hypothetical protein [Planctomycetota bacterium]